MAGIDNECCEMADSELQPILMWEDSYSQFESLIVEHKISPISDCYDLVSEIRGTFALIINYFQTFQKFATWTEALNQTFSALDVLDKCKQNAKSLPEYLTKLMAYLEEAAMEVHTACFITHRSKPKIPHNSEIQINPKPLEIDSDTEIETATGAKKRKTSRTWETLKGDANVSPVTLQNRFQNLTNDETPDPSSGDTVASQSKMSKVKPVSNMETNQSEEAAIPVRTVRKEPRPPPITVLGHSNVFKINKEIKSLIKGDLKVVNTREGLSYYTTSVEDHRIVKKFFSDQTKNFIHIQ